MKTPKSRRPRLLRIAALATAGILVLPLLTAARAAEEWDGESRELAWTCYAVTQWGQVGNFYYAEDGTVCRSLIPDQLRTLGIADNLLDSSGTPLSLGDAVNEVCRDCPDYAELLLSVAYVLNLKGNSLSDEVVSPTVTEHSGLGYRETELTNSDYAYVYPFFQDSQEDPRGDYTVSESLTLVLDRLRSCVGQYNVRYGGGSASVYSADPALGAALQAMLYGTDYLEYTRSYTPETAQAYLDALTQAGGSALESIPLQARDWSTFAWEVLERYSVIQAAGHYVVA